MKALILAAIRCSLMFTAGVAILLFVAYPLRAAATISTFNTDTEGWSAVGDVAGPVTWLSSGGNPAGHIELTDQVIGGVTYFVAPAKFHGNYSSAYGTSLTFDLRQSYTGSPNQFDDSDVILVGGGLTLVFDTPMNPANNGWTLYNVPLSFVGMARFYSVRTACHSSSNLGYVGKPHRFGDSRRIPNWTRHRFTRQCFSFFQTIIGS
jgi:laminin B (domain IV)